MSFDSSRFTFDPWNDFFGVVMEQGRVQLDSDWNEWLAEFARRIQAGTLDTLGKAVVPVTTKSGFEIAMHDHAGAISIRIGPGRMYVDGLLVQNHGSPPPNPRKWIPAGKPSTASGISIPSLDWDPSLDEQVGPNAVGYGEQPYYPNAAPFPQSGGPYLLYLDVWQREVTFLEYPDMVEKAVGIDTTGRLQTVWQVKWLNVSKVKNPACSSVDVPIWEPAAGLTTGVVQSSASGPCCLTSNTGYTGLENQLYRVEIHRQGAVGAATFKWSRDNASVATGVTSITQGGTVLTVQSTGKDSVLRFSPNQWVEITDDWLELNGLHGELHKVAAVSDTAKTITFLTAVSPTSFPVDSTGQTDPARHTRIVRWDGSTGDAAVPPFNTAVPIENGIAISFAQLASHGILKTGDFWVFAARAADGTVEYLDAAPPRGIYHHCAKLALMTLSSVALPSSGSATLFDQSQPPVGFLTFSANNPSGWLANFYVLTRANALNSSNFDMEIVYSPSGGSSAPITLEFFANLSIDPADSVNYAPNAIKKSNFVSVPSTYKPPSQAPVLSPNFPAPAISLESATGQIQLDDNRSVAFLTLQSNDHSVWLPYFSVSASPHGDTGSFNLEVVYTTQSGDSFATLERFEDLSLGSLAVTSAFIAELASPVASADPPLDLIGLSDCRIFWPSTPVPSALHVTATSWQNDNPLPLATFMSPGLQVTLDNPPDQNSVTSATVIVTLEQSVAPSAPGFAAPVIFLGEPTVSGNNIAWAPNAKLETALLANSARVRVTLKGHCIWNVSGTAYLDGQAFGQPGNSSNGPFTALVFPSGNGAKASDFESWFTLEPAPPLTFTLSAAVPPTLRGEGLTELVGDLLLTGTGGTPTAPGTSVPLVNITVSLSAPLTSRLFQGQLQDAVLLIDDPTTLNTFPSSPAPNGVGGSGLDFKTGQAPNIIIGQIVSTVANSVIFTNVPIDPPGSGTRTLRITNLRVNASASASASGALTPIEAFVSASGPVPLPLQNSQPTVGFVEASLSASASNAAASGTLPVIVNSTTNPGLTANPPSGSIDVLLEFTGNFAGAFKPCTLSQPLAIGQVDTAEESFDAIGLPRVLSAPSIPSIGLANQGTQFFAIFQNIPEGVQIFVTVRDVPSQGLINDDPDNPPAQAILVGKDGSGDTTPGGIPLMSTGVTTGPTPGMAGIPICGVPITPSDNSQPPVGTGQAIWEWVAPPQAQIQTLQFGVLLAVAPTLFDNAIVSEPAPTPTPISSAPIPSAPTLPVGDVVTATVTLCFSPPSSVGVASENDPIPRFGVGNAAPMSIFQVVFGQSVL